MQPTLQTFIGVFVNNLGIKYSMNVWSGIRDPGNFKIPDVHAHLAALIFNLLWTRNIPSGQVKRTYVNLHNTLKLSYPYPICGAYICVLARRSETYVQRGAY